MPPRIFTFGAKAASSQDVEKVVDHNGRDQIQINDKATKLTLAISPSVEIFSGHFALSSEEKKLTSEQVLCLWLADAGHNFFE